MLFELYGLILEDSGSAHKEGYKRVELLKLATGERENSFFGVLFDGVLRFLMLYDFVASLRGNA